MKAVVMAGGEGTRLRPMTASQPKPLLPVVGKPIMEHVLALLKRHGFDETVVTVQYLASLVRTYFGDGSELGMSLEYATEETPLGTAGSVKNAAAALQGEEPFLVISGDALTDFDLGALVRYHREQGALVTICLARVPDPVEFGIVIQHEDGRIDRFLEKPTWGQVFSDTVNTGIYVMEPRVLDEVAVGENVDWSSDVFPKLLERGERVMGYVAEGYWEDVGTHESYVRAQADVLSGKVDVVIDGFEVSPGVWLATGADVDPDAQLRGPIYVGPYARIEAGADVREFTVLGANVVVRSGAFVHRAILHDNVYVAPRANLRGCVIGRNTEVRAGARVEEGAVIGDEVVLGADCYISPDVRVYPFKTVEAGAVVNTSLIWEARAQRGLFGPRGVSGMVNVDITPEYAVRLASAYATSLRKGATVTTSRDSSRAARALKRAVISALTTSGVNVRDLEVAPTPVTRWDVAASADGGVILRTTPGDAQSIDIAFLDSSGADLSQAAQRSLERVFARHEFRRVFAGDIGDLRFPGRTVDAYAQELFSCVDVAQVREAALKVVVDCGGGAASSVLPPLLGRLGVDALIVGGGIDEAAVADSSGTRDAALGRLASLVASSRAALGVRFDPVGERLVLVDDTGAVVSDDRAVLAMIALVGEQMPPGDGGSVALPVTMSRAAERAAREQGLAVIWTATSPSALTAACRTPGVQLGADGSGGLVLPSFGSNIDGVACFIWLLALLSRSERSLSEILASAPEMAVLHRSISTPWAVKGAVMREVMSAVDGDETLTAETIDGVRVIQEDGSWVLVLPDPAAALTHVWAEGSSPSITDDLLNTWSQVVEGAGR
jgi:mannose-1-phosphate guanylyltransferase/phosphomannomutase